MNKTLQAHIALFAAQLIYAISFVVAKDLTRNHIDPFGLVVFRALGAALLMWVTQLLFIKEKERPAPRSAQGIPDTLPNEDEFRIKARVERKDIGKMLLLAVFGVAINQTLFLTGLNMTSPISAAIMMITSPILVLIIAALIIRERITWLKSTGVLFGFAGAAALMYSSSRSTGALDDPLGDLLVFINAMSWGTYLVLVKPMMKKYHTVTILSWVFLFGFFLVLPVGYKQAAAVNWGEFDHYAWFTFLFVIVGTTYIAYILNTYALKALSPSVVSAYIYLQPVLTALIAIGMHRDELNWAKCGSALLIFAGVYLVSWQPKR